MAYATPVEVGTAIRSVMRSLKYKPSTSPTKVEPPSHKVYYLSGPHLMDAVLYSEHVDARLRIMLTFAWQSKKMRADPDAGQFEAAGSILDLCVALANDPVLKRDAVEAISSEPPVWDPADRFWLSRVVITLRNMPSTA